jgi:outer membrane lipoprotein-sorting protein
MKSLRVVLLSAGVLLAAGNSFAQTADEIVNKHIEALGGKAKLNAIKTIYTEYDMEVMNNQASGVSYLVNGKGYRNEIDFGGQKIIQCVTDKGGWGINPMMGQTAPEAMPEDQVKSSQGQLAVGGPLMDYASKGNTVELQGRDTLNGVNAFKLKVKSKEGTETTMWIDPTTYYILKSTNKATISGQEVETSAVFSNYKKTDYGYVMPTNTELTLPQGFSLNITNKKVEINKDIDPKIFEMQK